MKLWLDDLRPAPLSWIWVQSAPAAVAYLATGEVTHLSLDHDLGRDDGTGYDVACYVEKAAHTAGLPRLQWTLHSANPVGVARMRQALQSAERAWAETPVR